MGEKSPFFPATEAFSITQCNCIVIGSLIRRLIFSSLILAEACSPGRSSPPWKQLCRRRRGPAADLLDRRTRSASPSPTAACAPSTSRRLPLPLRSQRVSCRHPALLEPSPRFTTASRALFSAVFTAYGPRRLRATQSPFSRRHRHFLMPHHCTTCRAPLQDADGHGECVGCLGKPHADDAFTGGSCSHCESMSLASLRSRAAFFRSDTDRALLSPSSREPARKRQRGRPVQRPELSELTSAQCPRASPSPSREQSPVLFSRPEQRPSADASDFVSFGGSDDELPDDSVSLAASEPEHWVGESDDPAPLPLLEPIDHSAGMDAELFRVLSKAVEELDLEWAPLEEPSRSRLDEWFLPGRRQAPRQRSAPFFPEVHEELAKSWRAPYSARLHTSHRSALTSVDGSEEKGYEHLPPLDEAVAAHLCPPAAVGWKTKRSLPSKPCRTTSALAGRAYASAGQAASALHSMAIFQVFQAKLLRSMDESGVEESAFRDLRSATDLALRATKAATQAIGRSMASLVVLERHLWLNLTEIKDQDKTAFLDAPVSPSGLFGPAVEGFTERFTAAQKSSQAMRHFLPKRSSSASAPSRPRPAPAQQTKPAPSASQAAPPKEHRHRSRSANKRTTFPRRQGPRPKIVLDPGPPKSS
ncbi:hypothetical protein DPX16_8186 [Anabarilius grahami]|uniref:Lamina-associated polypeptide 2 n=1 Tax=Anabarilius grahami TaxID=495550 RepID=A0A3N0Y832_ANAGA|nr:hypothetical protein DPX16_8186 [Anabarilius grahami]